MGGACGRTPQDKIVVRVDELIEPDRAVLGPIDNHPSMAHSMPNPIDIRGTVLHRSPGWAADRVIAWRGRRRQDHLHLLSSGAQRGPRVGSGGVAEAVKMPRIAAGLETAVRVP